MTNATDTMMEIAMTDNVSASPTVARKPEKGKFFNISPDIRGGGPGHGLDIANEDKLVRPPRHTVDPPTGDPNQYPEKPQLVYNPKLGDMPRDLEELGGIWIISERLKQIFETVDSEGFAFVACDFSLADGSKGPQRYLCNVIRTLDALDEEASRLKIKIGDYVNGKFYSFAGGASLTFKKEVVGSAHIFRTPYSGEEIFCARVLRDALKAADLKGIWLSDAADL